MKIVIFGANGKVGSLLTLEALKRGYNVRAFIHGAHNFAPHQKLEILQGDIYDAITVQAATKGCDVVLSALGSWGTPKKDILTVGVGHIIDALESSTTKRIVTLTGADSRASGDHNTVMHRLTRTLLKILAPRILEDGETHIMLLEKSQLDWTVVRSPVMNDRGDPRKFKLTNIRPQPWTTINRQSVALAMLDSIENKQMIKKPPFISRT